MKILDLQLAQRTFPTGDPKFAVMQAFPAGIKAKDADPFLMCDFFGPTKSAGRESDPDRFPVGWHPHRGMDIMTYLVEGVGRHADSLGNRGEYASPGMQWISVGSGIEHAEGGGTPAGQNNTGFQIWINVPANRKMDDPRYGTEPPERIPVVQLSQEPLVTARVLAGSYVDMNQEQVQGPFQTVTSVQMVDYSFAPDGQATHSVQAEHDNCLAFVFKGSGKICGRDVRLHNILRFDASQQAKDRDIVMQAGGEGMSVMIFAGKRLNEPIAWQGPFVMNTHEQIDQTEREFRAGRFPPKRASWDYKRLAAFPPHLQEQMHT